MKWWIMYENYSSPLLASEWGLQYRHNMSVMQIIWMSMFLNTLLYSTHVQM